MQFRYTGTTSQGDSVTETVEAKDRFEVYEIARKSGHTVQSVKEAHTFGGSPRAWFQELSAHIGTVKTDEVVMFTRNLSAMLKAGLSISRALSVAERQSGNPKLAHAVKKIAGEIASGKPFGDVLMNFPSIFSPLYVAMVKAGDESGKLAESLLVISDQLARASALKKKVRGAMMYPLIVIVVMCLIGVLMMIYVVPTLTAVFKEMNTELPTSTKLIIAISDFLAEDTLLALLGAVVIGGGVFALTRLQFVKRVLQRTLLYLPVIGTIAKEVNAARTARTLSSLLSSGVDVVRSIVITKDVVQNVHYREVLDSAAKNVEKGNPLSSSFVSRTDLYPVLVGEMVAVGEETGKISDMLQEVAIFYEGEVERKTKDLSTIIEPLLMVVIGGGVGFFALAMITPIYSISNSIG